MEKYQLNKDVKEATRNNILRIIKSSATQKLTTVRVQTQATGILSPELKRKYSKDDLLALINDVIDAMLRDKTLIEYETKTAFYLKVNK